MLPYFEHLPTTFVLPYFEDFIYSIISTPIDIEICDVINIKCLTSAVQMQRRDEEMEQGAEELRSLKNQIKVTENQMSEKQQFLESEQENNHEKEKVVDVAERQVSEVHFENDEVKIAVWIVAGDKGFLFHSK